MSMIEKVARAICDAAWGNGSFDRPPEKGGFSVEAKEQCLEQARAAIAAMREPNKEMMAGADSYVMHCHEHGDVLGPTADGVYRAMIDAALGEVAGGGR